MNNILTTKPAPQLKRLEQAITEHPQGITISTKTGKPYKKQKGYAVAIREATINEIKTRVTRWRENSLAELLKKYYVGSWIDDTGKVWLDWAIIIQSKQEALKIARKHNQLAIFGFKENEVIYV